MLRGIIDLIFGIPMWLVAIGAPIAIGIALAAAGIGFARRSPAKFAALLAMICGPYPALILIVRIFKLGWQPNFLFTTFIASVVVAFCFGHWLDEPTKNVP